MKKIIALVVLANILFVGMLASAWGQEAQLETTDARSLLEARKRQQAVQFDVQEQACAKTFAVTDCVSAVNVRRRLAVAALRKEENALNDVERRQRERERMQSLQEKAQQRVQQAPTVDPSTESAEERLRRQQDKLANHAAHLVPKAAVAPKVHAPIDALKRQQNAADHAARQKAANERRAARDQKLKEPGKAKVDLPTPP